MSCELCEVPASRFRYYLKYRCLSEVLHEDFSAKTTLIDFIRHNGITVEEVLSISYGVELHESTISNMF